VSKEPLPSLESELTPKKRVDLRAIRSAPVDDEAIDQNSRRIGAEWGAQTSLPQPEPKVLLASLRIEVPDYLDRELAMAAVQQRCTKQYLVMKALRGAGFKIEEGHIMEDGRKVKRKG
jgi:hypothetical protein